MNLIEQIIEEKIRRYGIWLLSIVITLSILLISWFKSFIYNFSFNIPGVFSSVILFIGLILLIIIFLWIWEKISYFCSIILLIFKNKINSIPRISKWIFQGSLKIIGDSLEITSSNSGCLIRDYLYKNFLMSFNLKIPNGGRAGIIFRAQDLENYLMFQIELADVPAEHKTIVYDIVPHIRFLGNFETLKIDIREPYHPTILEYINGKGLLINLEVKDCTAVITIESNNKVEEFRWNIPTHTEPNIIQRPERKIEPLDGTFTSKLWFRNKYGKVGFRAFGLEKAIISNFKIEKI